MKKLLLIGSIVLVLGLLIAGSTTFIFAHGPDNEVTPANGGAWEAMHEACENGDWEKMAEAAKEVHGEDFGHMPHRGGMGGHMGRGMMGW
ncbi:hypothetical protein ACFLV4_07745 [Chloroflexota bacterium]